MNEDIFNMAIRKYLKKLGVTAQREIETAVRSAVADGALKGDETLKAKAVVTIDGVDVSITVDGDIPLE